MTATNQAKIIAPYGGKLVNLVVTGDERSALIEKATHLQSIKISARNLCDLELLATGGFSPLDRFMGHKDYERVLEEMRLVDGTLFPLPITLTVDKEAYDSLGEEVVLRDTQNNLIAVMKIEEAFPFDKEREAKLAYGSTDSKHPMVSEMVRWGNLCVSGELKVINLPRYYDFKEIRQSPGGSSRIAREDGQCQCGCIPDPQSTAPHSRRTDQARRRCRRRQPAHPPGGRSYQAR